MKNSSERIRKWRNNVKNKLILAFGGKCLICGYSKSTWALEFHHIIPSDKKFTISSLLSHPRGLNNILDEARKCVLLCSNCHREVEHGITKIENENYIFDESTFFKNDDNFSKKKNLKFKNRKINLRDDEFIKKLNKECGGNKSKLSILLNVSETAIRKRIKRIEMSNKQYTMT